MKNFTFYRRAELVSASSQQGFTLIELLVVVLIIGILSAVALPQYQKAVEKSRATEALVNVRSIVQSVQLYKMANGAPTKDFDALDVVPNGTRTADGKVVLKNFTYDIRNLNPDTLEGFEVVATRNDADNDVMKYYIYFSHGGNMNCVAMTEAAKVPCTAACGNGIFHPHSPASYSVCRMN